MGHPRRADPRFRQLGIPRLRLRRRALRRCRTRSPRVLRPEAERAGRQRARRAPTATWRRTISSSRPPAPKRGSSSCSGGAGGTRMPTIRCSGRSTRTTSGSTARTPATSAIFARTASSGSRSRCPRTSSSSIPRPTCRRPRRSWTCGGAFRRSTTWPSRDRTMAIAWPRGPNQFGGYQLDARVTTLQEQALGALTNHAQIQNAPPQQMLDDLSSFQRVLFTNHRVRALSDAVREGTRPLPDPDPPLNELEEQGKVVFVRACAQCHGGPGQSTPQAPVVRFHNISSQCPRPVDTVTPARFAFAACPPRLARNARTYEITLRQRHQDPSHELRSRPCLVDRVRRCPSPPGRLGQIRHARHCAGSARPPRTSTTTARPRSRRWSITTSSSSSARQANRGAGCRATVHDNRRHELRSAAASRRARGAPGVPAEAVEVLKFESSKVLTFEEQENRQDTNGRQG